MALQQLCSPMMKLSNVLPSRSLSSPTPCNPLECTQKSNSMYKFHFDCLQISFARGEEEEEKQLLVTAMTNIRLMWAIPLSCHTLAHSPPLSPSLSTLHSLPPPASCSFSQFSISNFKLSLLLFFALERIPKIWKTQKSLFRCCVLVAPISHGSAVQGITQINDAEIRQWLR